MRPLAAALLVLCSAVSARALPVAISYSTLSPTMTLQLAAKATTLTIPLAQVLASIKATPLAGLDPCTTGGGTVKYSLAPDSVKNSRKAIVVAAEANGDLKYTVPPEFQNIDPTKLTIFYRLTASCSNAALAEPRTFNGRIKLTVSKDPCWSCLTGCTLNNGVASCSAWASYCPAPNDWPAATFGGVVWSVSIYFQGSSCSNINRGKPAEAGAYTLKTLMDDLYQAGGNQVFSRYGFASPKSAQLGSTVCKDASQTGTSYGVVQFYFESLASGADTPKFLKALQDNWHKKDACTLKRVNGQDQSAIDITDRLCREIVATGQQRASFGGICIKGANPNKKYKVGDPLKKACFPGDATLMRIDPDTGARLGAARMDEVRIGDVVECLKPSAPQGPGLTRDDQQEYVRGSCHVFGYHDANSDVTMDFVALHYTDENGAPAKLRATKEHLVYVAPSSNAAPASAPLDRLPPGGFARRADGVHPGDLLVVRSEAAAAGGAPLYYTARVEGVTTEMHAGSFAPLLTDAGLPIVDGVAAFSWAHLPEHDPPASQNLGEYYRHMRLWGDYYKSRASGCAGDECPCLDAPDDKSRRCVRFGDRLADLPQGLSDFAQRTVDLWEKADSEGRTHWDYETGIALGRLREAVPLLAYVEERIVRAKPHSLAMLLTDMLMVKPKKAT